MFGKVGGILAIIIQVINFTLLIFVTGIAIHPFRICGHEMNSRYRKYFGWKNIPFDFEMRNRLNA